MSFKIVISEEAEFQIYKAYMYYSEINDALAERFNDELVEAIDFLKENPEHFQNRYREIRIVLTKNFPYSVHYIIKNNTVYVLKMLHQKQFYK